LSSKSDDQLVILNAELVQLHADITSAKHTRSEVRELLESIQIPDFISEELEDIRVEFNTLKK
jgi:hypothetical protein